jgi:hypothetical protein
MHPELWNAPIQGGIGTYSIMSGDMISALIRSRLQKGQRSGQLYVSAPKQYPKDMGA